MAHIAITACGKIEDYKHAVLNTGSEVRIVDQKMSVADALTGIDGLLLTGGDDVAPTLYGEDQHPAVKAVAPERDDFEIALVREARKRGVTVVTPRLGEAIEPMRAPTTTAWWRALPPIAKACP
jgi:gamma-glutamyl-gamma-aminobutyrate hydrolase PuuD